MSDGTIDRKALQSIDVVSEAASTWRNTLQLKGSHRFTRSIFTFIQKKWAKFSDIHNCALISSLRRSPIVNEVIDSGILIGPRRIVRKYTMISTHHPYTSRIFKSMSEIRNEEIRHLIKHRWMIHPFSIAALHYSFFMTLIYLYSMVFILPANWAFVRFYRSLRWHTFIIDMIVTINMFISCFVGYFDQNTMFVHMKRTKIIRNYIMTFFIFDLLSCLTSYNIHVIYTVKGPTPWSLLKWTMIFRLARIFSIDGTLEIFRLYYGFSDSQLVIGQIAIKSYFTIVICMAVVLFIEQIPSLYDYIPKELDSKRAQISLFNTVSAMFGVGKLPNFDNIQETFGFALCSILALFLHYWIISKLYTLWQRITAAKEVGEDYSQQLDGYMKYKGLPPLIRGEIHCYFQFTFQKRFYKERSILGMLSENLKKEIPNYKCGPKIERIRFLHILPHNLLLTVVANMVGLYYSTGDVIFRPGTENKSLLYLKFGTLGLFDKSNVEICHLENDSYYGDISVVIPQTREVSMIAIAPCEVYQLEHKTLFNVLEVYPDIKEEVLEFTRNELLKGRSDWGSSAAQPINLALLAPLRKPEKRWSVNV